MVIFNSYVSLPEGTIESLLHDCTVSLKTVFLKHRNELDNWWWIPKGEAGTPWKMQSISNRAFHGFPFLWGYPQIIHFRLGFSTINQPATGDPFAHPIWISLNQCLFIWPLAAIWAPGSPSSRWFGIRSEQWPVSAELVLCFRIACHCLTYLQNTPQCLECFFGPKNCCFLIFWDNVWRFSSLGPSMRQAAVSKNQRPAFVSCNQRAPNKTVKVLMVNFRCHGKSSKSKFWLIYTPPYTGTKLLNIPMQGLVEFGELSPL